MSFELKAKSIRETIKKYTQESLVSYFIRYLHFKPKQTEHTAERRPWIAILALEWSLELNQNPNAKKATDKQAQQILEDIWNMQSDASGMEHNNLGIVLRKMVIPQLRFQIPEIQNLFFLFRFFSILMQPSSSSAPKSDFQKLTGINFERFLLFSALIHILFTSINSPIIKYSDLIENLCPYFSFSELKKLLFLVGGNIYELEALIKNDKNLNRIIKKEEYFAEPFLIQKPLIIIPDGITTPHTTILSIGISEFILRTLKKADPNRFKNKFTSSFEKYLEQLLAEFNHQYLTEKQIKSIYKKSNITGKVVDFIIKENDFTLFIDAKGAEPKSRVLITDDPRILRDQIKDIHLKGIEQVAKCIEILSSTNEFKTNKYENRYALIVTHQDYYIGDCCSLLEYLLPEHSKRLKKIINNMLPPENIHFCAIHDLEEIVHVCNENRNTICDFLSFCKKQQMSANTKKFDMRQHIWEFSRVNNISNNSPIGSNMSQKTKENVFEQLIEMVAMNQNYWNRGWIKTQKNNVGLSFGKKCLNNYN